MPKPDFSSKTDKIAEIIRVDHAGEYGAKRIYEGQIKFTKNLQDKILINSMLEQEKVHLNYFEAQLNFRNLRPTLFMPLWHVGGYIMGAVSARFGLKSAMLVTEAVEEVIEGHYSSQLAYLRYKGLDSELAAKIEQFRQDEIEHKNIAIHHESNQVLFSKLTANLVKVVCKIAIFMSKKL
jgi:ubiquinone biosynthesis monooxygenase Coq7